MMHQMQHMWKNLDMLNDSSCITSQLALVSKIRQPRFGLPKKICRVQNPTKKVVAFVGGSQPRLCKQKKQNPKKYTYTPED